jgi:hypothetical protein
MKFHWNCGRMGDLHGTFIVDQGEYDRLMSAIGTRIYFGEVLGKHSDVEGELGAEDLEVVTDDQAFLLKARELGIDMASGYNPLDYIADEEDAEDADSGEEDT